MKLAIFLILILLGICLSVYFCITVFKLANEHNPNQDSKKIEGQTNKKLLGLVIAQALLAVGSSIAFVNYMDFKLKFFEYFALVVGSLIIGFSFDTFFGSFFLYYWKLDLDEKQKKVCKYVKVLAVIAVILGLWVLTEGFARQDSIYPLISGISFTDGFSHGGGSLGGFGFKFYGLLIVSGAVCVYAYVDHMCYKKFKKHGIIDTLFVVAFIGGIIGARLWSCYVLEPEIYIGDFKAVLRIYDGGLAIMGGALGGIAIGVAYMLLFRRYIDVRWMMDVVIPAILIAQIIGRWGNFFNQEVYGKVCSEQSLWMLPTIIKRNMLIDGEYRVPLFIIEGCINLIGYFFIRIVCGKLLKFGFGKGYQGAMYISWYGLVRAVLEPLREGFTFGTHQEGYGYMQSWITAFVMIGIGIILFLALYFLHKFRMSKGLENENGERIVQTK